MRSLQENDIIMCDGSCGCAYHEKCLRPAVVAAELPEDDGWLCPACDCKVGEGVMHIYARLLCFCAVGGGRRVWLLWQ